MSEKWFSAYPHTTPMGAPVVDVREGGQWQGSRFICEATPADADRIVRAQEVIEQLRESLSGMLESYDVLVNKVLPDGVARNAVLGAFVFEPERARAALAAAQPAATAGAEGAPDHLWSMSLPPGASVYTQCCERLQSAHAGVTWEMYRAAGEQDAATAGEEGGK